MFDYAKLVTLCSMQILTLWNITRKGLFLENTGKQCAQQLQLHQLVKSIDQWSGTFFNQRAILLHLPADTTSEEPQNNDTVSFFM